MKDPPAAADDLLTSIGQRYQRFAEREARGRSPLYERCARAVAADPTMLTFLATLPEPKRQPNLLFAAARRLGGIPDTYADLRAVALERRAELTELMLARRTHRLDRAVTLVAANMSSTPAAAQDEDGEDETPLWRQRRPREGVDPMRREVSVDAPGLGEPLAGDLAVPEQAWGVVVFAHGSGSSRRSPRNRTVAEPLQRHGFATLLLDLLTPREEQVDLRTRELRFDVSLLAGRVVAAVDWVTNAGPVSGLPIGLFGASTGAAAALVAATARPAVRAVVSRGGQPDLAGDALPLVTAPTLLIVGGRDEQVLALNIDAAGRLGGEHQIEVVPGAGHLFEESGALEQVTRLAAGWFSEHLAE